MVSTVPNALLLASLPDLSTPHFLSPVIITAATSAQKRLVIVLYSPLFTSPNGEVRESVISHTERWDDVQRLLTFTYVQATKAAQELDKVLLEVDVLLKTVNEGLPEFSVETNAVFRVQGDTVAPLLSLPVPQHYVAPDMDAELHHQPLTSSTRDVSYPPLYPVTALGGTFDHLHAGHKILLSMGAWITSERLIVGITGDELLKNKAYKHVLEDIQTRKDRVRNFLTLFRPGIVYEIVIISDVYGPTGWDPNIQALVVSAETMSGAKAIISHRASQSLPALEIFIIDVISPTSSKLDHEDHEILKQTKMSSTFIREWISKQASGED
ncbi:Nucleotidylyl transferase [Guyanagaster necrorhizus]|uniref:Nucleotidylyl transferase n=1 Tax=Guyanagaster necrorhizus TaxID=856835 RepID=A0A9P7W3Q1_9AGAR|nr:Nucleotidylyl transferase [Guyanagaster necrorhizus MCA 3950]KAG7451410.1 Nucleotidylyl transferase [Guyanagaster necrorhizus MCA 3950]